MNHMHCFYSTFMVILSHFWGFQNTQSTLWKTAFWKICSALQKFGNAQGKMFWTLSAFIPWHKCFKVTCYQSESLFWIISSKFKYSMSDHWSQVWTEWDLRTGRTGRFSTKKWLKFESVACTTLSYGFSTLGIQCMNHMPYFYRSFMVILSHFLNI